MVSAHQSVGATKIIKLAENLKLSFGGAANAFRLSYRIAQNVNNPSSRPNLFLISMLIVVAPKLSLLLQSIRAFIQAIVSYQASNNSALNDELLYDGTVGACLQSTFGSGNLGNDTVFPAVQLSLSWER
jgi:hypothetical protein